MTQYFHRIIMPAASSVGTSLARTFSPYVRVRTGIDFAEASFARSRAGPLAPAFTMLKVPGGNGRPSKPPPLVVHDMTQCCALLRGRWMDSGRRRPTGPSLRTGCAPRPCCTRSPRGWPRPGPVASPWRRGSSSGSLVVICKRIGVPTRTRQDNTSMSLRLDLVRGVGIHGSAWSWSVLEVKTTVSAHGPRQRPAMQCNAMPV